MSSGSSAVRDLLAGYLSGRVPAERLVPALAAEYYGTADRGTREALRPLMDVVERAAPGVGRLTRTEGGAGFEIGLDERPFPASADPALRQAAEGVLATEWGQGAAVSEMAAAASGGVFARLIRAVRRWFSASA